MTDARRLLHGLSGIVGDLYGSPAPAKSAAPAPNAACTAPAVLPFDKLWHTADETVDWTDILVSETPTDGLTEPETWRKLHALAPRVLQGDTAAYLDALTLLNPVADLTPYVSALDVQTVSADEMRAAFSIREDLMLEKSRQYLCGTAVRIARDLFAAVPVLTVQVSAVSQNAPVLSVSFTRKDLNRVRFSFVDPIAFVQQCGGECIQ